MLKLIVLTFYFQNFRKFEEHLKIGPIGPQNVPTSFTKTTIEIYTSKM